MKKIISAQEAISFIKEGSTVMVGGFWSAEPRIFWLMNLLIKISAISQ